MEVVKVIVEALNKPPFYRKLNVLTFDSLSTEELFQIVSDVFQSLNDQPSIEIHHGELEQTINRIFNMLHVLRYKPFTEPTSGEFRQKLIQGDRNTIYNLLEWSLTNTESLKQRIYLASYLMKIEIPSDILGNSDIAMLYQQYQQLVEEFKKTHKQSVIVSNSSRISVAELRLDGVTMEKEMEIVSDRIEQIKKKLNNLPNAKLMFPICHNLRVEQEKKKEIDWKIQEETANVQQGQQRLFRLNQQLQEFQKRSVGLSAQALIKKLEEEVYVTSYIVEQKLPRELNQQKKEKEILENILYSNNISRASNENLSSKIQDYLQQINKLMESRLTASHSTDDKIVLFRQQAAIIAKKKDNLAEQFSQLKSQIQEIYSNLQYKQRQLEETVRENGDILKDNQTFQEYVDKFKTRNNIYKRYRNDIAALKAENGVLLRTVDILEAEAKKYGINTENLKPVSPNRGDEHMQNESRSSLLAQISQSSANIASLKQKLKPMIDQVRPLKLKISELSNEHEEKKRIYDKTSLSLNTNISKLLNEVNELQDEHSKIILEQGTLSSNTHIDKINLQRATQEFQNMVTKNTTTPTYRDRLNHKILESERSGKLLKEEQKQIRENEKKHSQQKNLWDTIHVLLRMKMKYLQVEREEMNSLMHSEKGTETLILR